MANISSVSSLTISGNFTAFEFYELVFLKLRESGITVTHQYGEYGPRAQMTVFVEDPHKAAKSLQDLDPGRFRIQVNDDPERRGGSYEKKDKVA